MYSSFLSHKKVSMADGKVNYGKGITGQNLQGNQPPNEIKSFIISLIVRLNHF